MTNIRTRSLRWDLVRRLVALQAVMLTLFVVLVIGALWSGGFLNSLEAEDDTIDALRDAVMRDANGGLALRDTPAMAKRRAEVPDFWFTVRDRDGHTVSEGAVPQEYARIGTALDGIGQARLGWNIGDPPRPTARLKWIEGAAGRIQILTGPGGAVPWRRVVVATSTFFLTVIVPILLLMTLATLVATPVVVRRTLAGLGRVVTQAERIEIDSRGARLPLADVPAEVTPLVAAVNAALGRLDDGYERQKRFLLDAAHEIRTPIAIPPLAITAGYEIAFESEVDQAVVKGDTASLERALTNLVQNAIQHGGHRGVITIRVDRPATISVTDEGPGVPAADRERVFEPFHRLQARERGVGLGLNLVQEIVRRHQARITLLDGSNGGACFRIAFRPASGVP